MSPEEELAARYGSAAANTLLDLLEFGEAAARLVTRGKTAYDQEEFLRLAAEAILHRIGEAVARLTRQSPEFIADHPAVDWRRIKATRNLLAHDYSRIDHEIVWNALAHGLPPVTEYVHRLTG